jgi:DnaK suppressor protein
MKLLAPCTGGPEQRKRPCRLRSWGLFWYLRAPVFVQRTLRRPRAMLGSPSGLVERCSRRISGNTQRLPPWRYRSRTCDRPPRMMRMEQSDMPDNTGSVLEFKPYKPKRGEEYMNPKQEEHFRSILLQWKHQLMEEVDRTLNHMQDDAANFPDPNDRATQESEFTLELRTRDRERKLISKIDQSIAAIDSGDYGFCETCGIEIGIRRLEARPTATLCYDCKVLDEIREKQVG